MEESKLEDLIHKYFEVFYALSSNKWSTLRDFYKEGGYKFKLLPLEKIEDNINKEGISHSDIHCFFTDIPEYKSFQKENFDVWIIYNLMEAAVRYWKETGLYLYADIEQE